MRKFVLAAAAGAMGLLFAGAPASALSTYQIQTNTGANLDGPNDQSSNTGFSITTANGSDSSDLFNPGTRNLNNTAKQGELSRDNWRGSGYYLRPNN